MGQLIQFVPRQPKPVEFKDEISTSARRGLYFALDAALSGLAVKGGRKCRSVVEGADQGLALSVEEGAYNDAAAMEIRTILRARCEICQKACGFALA